MMTRGVQEDYKAFEQNLPFKESMSFPTREIVLIKRTVEKPGSLQAAFIHRRKMG